MFSFFVGISVIGMNVFARPNSFLCPWLGGRGPERIIRRQAKLQHSAEAKTKAAGGNVIFADGRLMADRADLQPALRVESFRRFNHAADDGGERAAHGGGF